VIAFDDDLRARLEANLSKHERRAPAPAGLTPAVVAIVLCDPRDLDLGPGPAEPGGPEFGDPEGASFLLCLRSAALRRHPGQLALPGGRVEPGEADLETAVRELGEELGLFLGPDDLVGRLDDYPTRSGFVVTPVVLWSAATSSLSPDPGEVATVYRVGLRGLVESEPQIVEGPERGERPILRLPLGNVAIHAPTAAILLQFRQVGLRGRTGERVDHLGEPGFAAS
jgi:8-oxo-dGTP pyrophosphatase MutT (NUDIX family)